MADERTQILLAGLGGQGVLFGTGIVLQAALARGLDVLASETHGMAQRGGSVVSHVKLGPFLSPLVRSGQGDLLLSLQREEAFRNLHFVRPGGAVVVNAAELTAPQRALQAELEGRGVTFHVVDATALAASAGTPRAANVATLGLACAAGLIPFPGEELAAAIEVLAEGPRRESNLAVLRAALDSPA